MNKLLLTLGVLAALAAPAAAGRLDVDLSRADGSSQGPQTSTFDTSVDATRSIASGQNGNGGSTVEADTFDHGDLFGADSR